MEATEKEVLSTLPYKQRLKVTQIQKNKKQSQALKVESYGGFL